MKKIKMDIGSDEGLTVLEKIVNKLAVIDGKWVIKKEDEKDD